MAVLKAGEFTLVDVNLPDGMRPNYTCFGCHGHCPRAVKNFVGREIGLCAGCRKQLKVLFEATEEQGE